MSSNLPIPGSGYLPQKLGFLEFFEFLLFLSILDSNWIYMNNFINHDQFQDFSGQPQF